jgi:hypothetical protein
MSSLASATRLRLQVFSTSWRVHPPRAWRPCCMPHPLMGLHPSELCSSRAAVRRLRRPYPHDVPPPTGSCSTRESASTLRPEGRRLSALLSWACCPPGLSPPLARHGLHRASPHALGAPPDRKRTKSASDRRVPAPQGVHSNGIGSSPKRPPALLGFAAF